MKTRFLKTTFLLGWLSVLPALLAAQDNTTSNPNFYNDFYAYLLASITAVVFVAVLWVLVHLLNIIVKTNELRIYQEQGMEAYLAERAAPKKPFWQRWYRSMTDAVPVAKEADILLAHDHDGIQELDNNLPPWWVAMFYITIAIGVVYFGYYHFSDYGMSSAEAYAQEMEYAEREREAFLARQANKVNESNVEPLTEATALAHGETIFQATCATCHGQLGEGNAGPNLTDNYWLHGGSIKDVFKTIKYGVPAKGMIAWKDQMSPSDMHKVASYIMTLQGTDPPNQKPPQGDIYEPNASGSIDSGKSNGVLGSVTK